MTESLHPFIDRLTKDKRSAAANLTSSEVRYSVDLYYQIQEFRKASNNQVLSMSKAGEPVEVLNWSKDTMEKIEKEIRTWLDIFTDTEPSGMGAWAKSICGIGPIISAGLLAHINLRPWRCYRVKNGDTTKACTANDPHVGGLCDFEIIHTVGHIWRFAGLDPTMKWNKGERRPWNASLKLLCWKIGVSFMKVHNNPNDLYGKVYRKRKDLEILRNNNGDNKETAERILTEKKYRKETEAYKAYSVGMLPPAQIDARARRYAVKLFLADWHGKAYMARFNTVPPLPYPIAILGHADLIDFHGIWTKQEKPVPIDTEKTDDI